MSQPLYKRTRIDNGYSLSQMENAILGNSGTVSKGKGRKVVRKSKRVTLATKVKRILRNDAESKEVLTSVSFLANATRTNCTATSPTLLNGMAQGLTGTTRVGLEVTHAYLEVDLMIYNNLIDSNTGPLVGDAGFWAIVLDRQPNSTATFATMFDNSLAIGEGTDFRITTTNQDRFKIVSRNEWSVGCAGTFNAGVPVIVSGAQPYHVKEYIDLSKMHGLDQKTNYLDNGGTIVSIDSGALYFVFASTTSDANNNTQCLGQAKYRFKDI